MEGAWAIVSDKTWEVRNRSISVVFRSTATGELELSSLGNLASGHTWKAAEPPAPLPRFTPAPGASRLDLRVAGHQVREAEGGAVVLEIRLLDAARGAHVSLFARCAPGAGALELYVTLENRGSAELPLVESIAPLVLTLAASGGGLRLLEAAPQGGHGFVPATPPKDGPAVQEWLAAEDTRAGEALMVGGDGGAGVITFRTRATGTNKGVTLEAGFSFPPPRAGRSPSCFQLAPGERAVSPIVFLALAKGDADDAANQAFRYLKTHVLPKPLPNSPYASYCIWLTDTDVETVLLKEMELAKRLGFDVFYNDASWYEGSSTIPGMNDWMAGLGSYRESAVKFPSGLAALSKRIRAAGMRFGIWVDPGNVDSKRVASGEIPESWVARIDGKPLANEHPSLSPWTQLCLGNPDVVEWVIANLDRIVEAYDLEWMKWDPSGTVDHACTREDHGHHKHNGAHAAYEGKMRIWTHLIARFPRLSAFECEPSLRHSRLNAGPRTLMPGGYSTLFMVGPMVSPLVWDSLASTQSADTEKLFGGTWYGASALDYRLRQCLMQGIAFGNINGSEAQLLSNAPPGFLEALKRSLIAFKRFRHLLFEDVYHPRPVSPDHWSALEYVTPDASEAVVFLFRHKGGAAENTIPLRGLDRRATYVVTSLNDRPGRERQVTGEVLASKGLTSRLPNDWLARGDAMPGDQYMDQLEYGSDIVLLRRAP